MSVDAPCRRAGRLAAWCLLGALLVLLGGAGCATSARRGMDRPFAVGQDTFAFANELEWEYEYNPATGRMDHRPRRPPAAFAQRCFPVALAARKFFYHATFDPGASVAGTNEYRRLARQVLARGSRAPSPPERRVVIPGYTNVWDFSAAQPELLKSAIGGKWQSYVQRGHWRMVFPFSRAGQVRACRKLEEATQARQAPIVHVVTFPRLALNHVLVVAECEAKEGEVYFTAYDPNTPEQPLTLVFDRAARRFVYPRTGYFEGGPVNLYEVYRGWCY